MSEIRRLLPYIRPHLLLLALSLILLVGSGILDALIITLLGPIFNQMSPAAGQIAADKFDFLQSWLSLHGDDRFLRIAAFLVLFSLLKGFFLYAAEYMMSFTGQKVVAGLRKDLNRHLLSQSMAFFARNPTGKLMARVITDTERLQETVSKTMTDFCRQVILLLLFLCLVFYIDWKLSLLSFLIAPLVLSITVRLGRRIRSVSLRSQENLSDISHTLQESISGQKIVQTFGMESHEESRFNQLVERLVGVNLKVARISALSSPLMEFIGYVAFVPFLLYANFQINRGFTVGAFVVFVAALFRLYEPVRKLSRMHLHFQQASASAQRVFEILDQAPEIRDHPEALPLPPFSGSIDFERVAFSYPGNRQPVLNGIDLRIQKAEIVALVGASGAGKTSLVSLIPRFYDVRRGAVRIDGIDIRKVTLRSLRSQISMVTQETFLFNDSIRNNIAYGRQDCSMTEIEEAAKSAFIHEFVVSLPRGYEEKIGERGHRLSGGQRQRIAIARAVLKKAPILILDEATSSLDAESERLVQMALENLMRNCTTVVIAHRLSTIRLADRIVVMKEGRIVEEGNHETLMRRSGVYQKLYELQFSDSPAVFP